MAKVDKLYRQLSSLGYKTKLKHGYLTVKINALCPKLKISYDYKEDRYCFWGGDFVCSYTFFVLIAGFFSSVLSDIDFRLSLLVLVLFIPYGFYFRKKTNQFTQKISKVLSVTFE